MTANALILEEDTSFLRLHPTPDGRLSMDVGNEEITINIELNRAVTLAIRNYLNDWLREVKP